MSHSSSHIVQKWTSHLKKAGLVFLVKDLNGEFNLAEDMLDESQVRRKVGVILNADGSPYLNQKGVSTSLFAIEKSNKIYSYIAESLKQLFFLTDAGLELKKHQIIFPVSYGEDFYLCKIKFTFSKKEAVDISVKLQNAFGENCRFPDEEFSQRLKALIKFRFLNVEPQFFSAQNSITTIKKDVSIKLISELGICVIRGKKTKNFSNPVTISGLNQAKERESLENSVSSGSPTQDYVAQARMDIDKQNFKNSLHLEAFLNGMAHSPSTEGLFEMEDDNLRCSSDRSSEKHVERLLQGRKENKNRSKSCVIQ